MVPIFFFLRRILSEISVYYKLKYKRKMVRYYFTLPSPWMFLSVVYVLLCIAFPTLEAWRKSGPSLISQSFVGPNPGTVSFLKWRSEEEGGILNLLLRAHSRQKWTSVPCLGIRLCWWKWRFKEKARSFFIHTFRTSVQTTFHFISFHFGKNSRNGALTR